MEPVPYAATDEQGAIAHFVDREPWPANIRDRYVALINSKVAELKGACEIGDEVWICRSRFIGPLAGHEGLGIVRNGQVVRYDSLIDY